MLKWKRARVLNFSPELAPPYVAMLVRLDGEPYNQTRFFNELVKAGVVSDVADKGSQEATDKLRYDRWDSYSNRIREYGLGFSERRSGGPTIWRVSPIARYFDSGELTYRQFMALQLTRTQVPTPAMPITKDAEQVVAQGLQVRPLALTLGALQELGSYGEARFLAEPELSQLQRVEKPEDLPGVMADIVAGRGGTRSKDWVEALPSPDIWFNELSWTGYLRIVLARGEGLPDRVLVPRWARQVEAAALNDAIPLQSYVDLESVNGFHDFLGSVPTDAQQEVLRTGPAVVVVDVPGDAQWDSTTDQLTGHFSVLGGLERGDSVVLRGDSLDARDQGTLFEAGDAVQRATTPNVAVALSRVRHNANLQPIKLER